MSFRPRPHCTLGGLLVITAGSLACPAALAQQASDMPDDAPAHLVGDEASRVDLGAGVFDVQGDRGFHPTAAGQVEFRYGRKLFFIGPALGLLATTKGAVFGYGGIYADSNSGRSS